jgi:hypothetical protein
LIPELADMATVAQLQWKSEAKFRDYAETASDWFWESS